MVDIVLLGTAALVPLPERALSAAMLNCSGRAILFDCGEGTQTAIRRHGRSPMDIDIIALTHYHGDHIFGLPGLMQTMCSLGRVAPLYLTGPAGLEDELAPILKLAGALSYDVRALEPPEDGLYIYELIGGWHRLARLSAFKTEHRVPSVGYCFMLERDGRFSPDNARKLGVPVEKWSLLQSGQSVRVGQTVVQPCHVMGERRKGLKFVFSGDTRPCEPLEQAARDADLLICDATYGEEAQSQLALEYGHSTFAQTARLAANANVKRLWLTHYSQRMSEPSEHLPEALERFAGAECGEDGKKIELAFSDE